MRERQPFGDCELELLNFDGARTPYDVALEIIDDRNHDDYRLMLIVRADMYSKQDAELLLKSYQKLIRAFTSTPGVSFAEPGIYEPQEVERALAFGRGMLLSALTYQRSMPFLAAPGYILHLSLLVGSLTNRIC